MTWSLTAATAAGAGMGVACATPLILWAIGPDRAPSLSKDLHPIFAAVIVAAASAVISALHVIRRRSASSAEEAPSL